MFVTWHGVTRLHVIHIYMPELLHRNTDILEEWYKLPLDCQQCPCDNNSLFLRLFTMQPDNRKSEEPGEQNCEGDADQLLQCDQADCESVVTSCLTAADSAASTSTACNGSVDSGIGSGCRSSFASGDRLPLKTLTSSEKLSSLICSPVDEQQSPMSSTSSFLMPTPTTEEMCDEWSLVSDNKSEGGETTTGIHAVLFQLLCDTEHW